MFPWELYPFKSIVPVPVYREITPMPSSGKGRNKKKRKENKNQIIQQRRKDL